MTLQGYPDLRPGSETTQKQFLLIHTIFPRLFGFPKIVPYFDKETNG